MVKSLCKILIIFVCRKSATAIYGWCCGNIDSLNVPTDFRLRQDAYRSWTAWLLQWSSKRDGSISCAHKAEDLIVKLACV